MKEHAITLAMTATAVALGIVVGASLYQGLVQKHALKLQG